MQDKTRWVPLFVSLLITPVCLLIAAISGGAGHGDYTAAIVMFPYAALFIVFFDRFPAATMIMASLAILQFPLYGAAMSIYARKKRMRMALVGVLCLHLLIGSLAVWVARYKPRTVPNGGIAHALAMPARAMVAFVVDYPQQ